MLAPPEPYAVLAPVPLADAQARAASAHLASWSGVARPLPVSLEPGPKTGVVTPGWESGRLCSGVPDAVRCMALTRVFVA